MNLIFIQQLKKVILFHSLVDVWRESFPKSRQYTWLKMNCNIISAAKLDRIYVQKGRRGRFFDSKNNPTPISDHYYVSVMVKISNTSYKSYLHFYNSLLQDRTFVHLFPFFWRAWRERKTEFKSLSQWWDIGKIQIQSFCQQYVNNNVKEIQKKTEQLEKKE